MALTWELSGGRSDQALAVYWPRASRFACRRAPMERVDASFLTPPVVFLVCGGLLAGRWAERVSGVGPGPLPLTRAADSRSFLRAAADCEASVPSRRLTRASAVSKISALPRSRWFFS